MNMLMTIAPANPVQIAVIIVAVILQVIARVSVRLCSSIFLSYKKSPFRGINHLMFLDHSARI